MCIRDRDIDFLARFTSNAPENLKLIFADVCTIRADDAVVFDPDSLIAQAITEGADYHGVRMKLTSFLERSRSVLQFDLGFGDVIVPHPERMVYPSLLDMGEINLWAYSRESIIAEKFQAMLYLCLLYTSPHRRTLTERAAAFNGELRLGEN